MNILVSGGAGLIGSHLCRKLLSQGHVVICQDNGDLINIKDISENPNFILARGGSITPLPDQIYNLASPTAPSHFKANPIDTIKTNVYVTEDLLKLALNLDIPFLQSSSIRVLESCDTFNDNACYIEGKRIAETLCYEYQKLGADVRIPRMFNVFGPGMKMNDSRVIPTFIRKALNNDIIYVYGNGLQKDSFTYVEDMADALIGIMSASIKRSYSCIVSPFTIGNSEFISILDLARLIKKEIGSKSPIFYKYGESNFRKFNESNIDVNVNTDLFLGIRKTIPCFY